MGRDKSLGANPVDLHRKRMQEREAKRNKEVRKKTQEAAILHKDTSKIERKINQYKEIMQTRKLTAAEREKLQKMEMEVEEIKEKQKKAGVAPKELNRDAVRIGYDPMAQTGKTSVVIGGMYGSSDSDSDGNGTEVGRSAVLQDDLDDLGIPTIAVVKDEASKDAEFMLPMPPGTPPLSPKDLGVGLIWPPLPSGPSPLFLQNNPQTANHRTHAHTESDRGRGRGRGRGGYRPQHPYSRHASSRPPPPLPPFAQPPIAGIGSTMPRIRPPPPRPPAFAPPRPKRPVSATVLAAEPQVRDLKKELTALVPSAISRKTKQKERERVLSSVPAVPRMVVNAAPDIGSEADNDPVKGDGSSSSAATLLGSFKPHSGIRFTSGMTESQEKLAKKNKDQQGAPGDNQPATSSLDDEYQRFLKQMDSFLQ
ncbi:hypothetical protein H4R99_002288 [Coemansia sp. RSA 1722]|nr:hypothetical protein H4R99_002288 [Coemansia sp. RSA 1722]